MSQLNTNDYKQILEFYNKPVPSTHHLAKVAAEHILASKLCRCIKKVDRTNEKRAIGICTRTIFNNKGFTRGKFKCKGTASVKFRKTRTTTPKMKTMKRRT